MKKNLFKAEVSDAADQFLKDIQSNRGLAAGDIPEEFLYLHRLAMEGSPDAPPAEVVQEIIRRLRELPQAPDLAIEGQALEVMLGGKALGLHMGAWAYAAENDPFYRDNVGFSRENIDTHTLVLHSYAAWITRQTDRGTVIAFRNGEPWLLYMDVVWDRRPPLFRGKEVGGSRQYISSAVVLNLVDGSTEPMKLTTTQTSEGGVEMRLERTSRKIDPALVEYLKKGTRRRPSPRNPIDRFGS